MSVMVWAVIYDGCKRPELVIVECDPESKRGGYSTKSYIATVEPGLLPDSPGGYDVPPRRCIDPYGPRSNGVVRGSRNPTAEVAAVFPGSESDRHMWWHPKRAVYDVNPQFNQITGPKAQRDALVEVLPQAWAKISDQTLGNILESMPRRIQAGLAANGWQTKY